MAQSYPGQVFEIRTRTVGATSTWVVRANGARNYMMLQNVSNEIIYINFGTGATSAQCIALQPAATAASGSDRYEMYPARGNLTKHSVYAVCTSGSKTLVIVENSPESAPPLPGNNSSSSSSSDSSSSSGSSESSSSESSSSESSSSQSSASSASSASESSASSSSSSSTEAQNSSSSSSTSSWSSSSQSSGSSESTDSSGP